VLQRFFFFKFLPSFSHSFISLLVNNNHFVA
jgi:hypothetical protein